MEIKEGEKKAPCQISWSNPNPTPLRGRLQYTHWFSILEIDFN